MKFEGIYTPVITPYRDDFSIDYERLAEVIEFLLDAGVNGLICAGTTGEYYAQSMQERFEMMKFMQQQIRGRCSYIVGTGAFRTEESIEYAQAAVAVGADALLVATPPYSLPTERENALHALAIDQAANLPIMLYNYPGRMGVVMGEEYLDRVGRSPNFCAIKESSGDPNRTHLLACNYPQIQMSCGMDCTRDSHCALPGLRRRRRFRQGPAHHVGDAAADGGARTGGQVRAVRQARYEHA
jgi:4-hydroxy-tetrahydrodipicolinate synthase